MNFAWWKLSLTFLAIFFYLKFIKWAKPLCHISFFTLQVSLFSQMILMSQMIWTSLMFLSCTRSLLASTVSPAASHLSLVGIVWLTISMARQHASPHNLGQPSQQSLLYVAVVVPYIGQELFHLSLNFFTGYIPTERSHGFTFPNLSPAVGFPF